MEPPERLQGRNVLLVEDEPRLREMLLRAMREMGFAPSGAGSAEQAMRLLEQRLHPVIIVDLNLPGTGGMDLVRSVRRRWPVTQAIIITGFGDLDAARQAIHLDVVDFLTKPCALGDLEIALCRAFQRLLKLDPIALAPQVLEDDEEERDDEDEEAEDESSHLRHSRVMDQPQGEGGDEACQSAPRVDGSLEFTPRDGSEALSMEDVERRAILTALEKHKGNRNAAAAELGISLRKLYYRLAQYQKNGPLSL